MNTYSNRSSQKTNYHGQVTSCYAQNTRPTCSTCDFGDLSHLSLRLAYLESFGDLPVGDYPKDLARLFSFTENGQGVKSMLSQHVLRLQTRGSSNGTQASELQKKHQGVINAECGSGKTAPCLSRSPQIHRFASEYIKTKRNDGVITR